MTPLDLDLVPEPPPPSPAVLAARHRRALVVGLGGGRESDSPMAKSSFAERRLRASDTEGTRYVDPMPGSEGAPPARGDAAPPARLDGGTGGADRLDRRADASAQPSDPIAFARPAGLDGLDPAASADRSARPERIARPDRPDCPGRPERLDRATAAPTASAAGLRLDDALVVPAGALMRGYLRCRALLLVGDIVGNVHCTAGPVVIRSGASLKGRLVATGDVYVCGTVGDAGGGAVITTRGKLTLAPGARVDGDVRSAWLDLYDGALLNGAAKSCED